MKCSDPGHRYALDLLDASGGQVLTFVKREGPGYPGNVGHYPGTNLQEVLRACIDRVKYLDNQVPCFQNNLVLANLRDSIRLLEERAAERHHREPDERMYDTEAFGASRQIELLPTCPTCGHIGCRSHGWTG